MFLARWGWLDVTLVVQASTNGYATHAHCDGLMISEKKATVSVAY